MGYRGRGVYVLKEKDLLMFIHIEKCAGTTFKSILLNNYFLSFLNLTSWHFWTNEDDKVLKPTEIEKLLMIFPYVKVLSSHGLRPKFGYEEKINRNINYLTILRDPIERYISNYYFQKDVIGVDWTFETFLQESRFNNFIVRKLTGREDLNRAKKVLDQFLFVGFTEEFNKTMILLKRIMESPFDIRYQKARVNSKKRGNKYAERLTDKELDIVKSNNSLDIKLYDYAYNNFKNKINKIPNIDQLERQFREENKDYKFPSIKKKVFKLYRKVYYRNVEKILNRIYHGPPTKDNLPSHL